jgi:hypothetical protein
MFFPDRGFLRISDSDRNVVVTFLKPGVNYTFALEIFPVGGRAGVCMGADIGLVISGAKLRTVGLLGTGEAAVFETYTDCPRTPEDGGVLTRPDDDKDGASDNPCGPRCANCLISISGIRESFALKVNPLLIGIRHIYTH